MPLPSRETTRQWPSEKYPSGKEHAEWPSVLPSQREEGGQGRGIGERVTDWLFHPYQKSRAQMRSQELQNEITQYNQDMKIGMSNLARAHAAFKGGDLRRAALYASSAYDRLPDGGKVEGIGAPEDAIGQRVANNAQAAEVIRIKGADGNISYIPVTQQHIDKQLKMLTAAFDPQNYIQTRVKQNAIIKEVNSDQITNPYLHDDGSVTHFQVDPATGEKKSYSYASKADFEKEHGKPVSYRVPPGEKERVEHERKKLMETREGLYRIGKGEGGGAMVPGTEPTIGYSKQGIPVTRGQAGGQPVYGEGLSRKPVGYTKGGMPITGDKAEGYEGEIYAAQPQRATPGQAGEPVSPANLMVKKDKDGKKQVGWVSRDNKFHVIEGVTDILNKKGGMSEKDIMNLRKDLEKLYNEQFRGIQGGYAEGRGGPEDIKQWVDSAIERILPGYTKKKETGGTGSGGKTRIFRNNNTGEVLKIHPDGREEHITPPTETRGAVHRQKIQKPEGGIKEPGANR